MREFNPRYAEAEGALLGQFSQPQKALEEPLGDWEKAAARLRERDSNQAPA